MKAGDSVHGWRLERAVDVTDFGSQGYLFVHAKTGAELLSMVAPDENKTFGVTFRTPPHDDTGVAHILEHSVLCGSRKYPVKEPFVELLKSSQQTFLNAFTYPDRTCYPVASCNLTDFYNLVDVYLDATLHPRCLHDPRILQQEGCHLELLDAEARLDFKGVVFNEMKGVYSDPEAVEARVVQRALFPDTIYAVDSGGDPAAIPDLSFEAFTAFHKRHYHPSNGRFYFYGDDCPLQRLVLLDAYLSEFEAQSPTSEIPWQPLWTGPEPKRISSSFAVGEDESVDKKEMVSVNWLLHEGALDVRTGLGLGMLNFLLVGTHASALNKALTESELGSSIIGGGLGSELKQSTFSIGLKNIHTEDAAKAEAIIMGVLSKHAEEGFSQDAIDAAINTIEFSLRENNTGSFPRGLSMMLRCMSRWLFDGDPFEPLFFSQPMAELKRRLQNGEPVFQDLLKQHFLKNPHCVVHRAQPSATLAKEMEQQERARLDGLREAMGEAGEQEVIEATQALRAFQEAVDPPEELACIPALSPADMPTETTEVPLDITQKGQGVQLLTTDLFTNGVVYLTVAFPLKGLSADDWSYMPLLCACLKDLGTEAEDYVQLSQRIGKSTGGVGARLSNTAATPGAPAQHFLALKGKAMADQTGSMLDIMRDMVLTVNFDNQAILRQLVTELKADLEASFVSSGHSLASSQLGAMYTPMGALGDQLGGLSYYRFTCGLLEAIDSDWDAVRARFEGLRARVVAQQDVLVHVTASGEGLTALDLHLPHFLAELPAQLPAEAAGAAAGGLELRPRQDQGLVVPSMVNYVGKAGNLYDTGYEFHASAFVVDKHVGMAYLWDQVRVLGGAYGAFSSFNYRSGLYQFLSYRDPNLLSTLDAYDGAGPWLASTPVDDDTLSKAVVGTLGDVDKYQLPDQKGATALARFLLKDTHEDRQRRRQEILGTTPRHFKEFGEALTELAKEGTAVAVASADALREAETARPGFLSTSTLLAPSAQEGQEGQ